MERKYALLKVSSILFDELRPRRTLRGLQIVVESHSRSHGFEGIRQLPQVGQLQRIDRQLVERSVARTFDNLNSDDLSTFQNRKFHDGRQILFFRRFIQDKIFLNSRAGVFNIIVRQFRRFERHFLRRGGRGCFPDKGAVYGRFSRGRFGRHGCDGL